MSLKNEEGLFQYQLKSDPVTEFGNVFTFKIDKALVTIRVIFDDEDSGADMAITNICTTPDLERGRQYGSRAVQFLVTLMKKHGLSNILALQVLGDASERFWLRNGFQKLYNERNDFRLA